MMPIWILILDTSSLYFYRITYHTCSLVKIVDKPLKLENSLNYPYSIENRTQLSVLTKPCVLVKFPCFSVLRQKLSSAPYPIQIQARNSFLDAALDEQVNINSCNDNPFFYPVERVYDGNCSGCTQQSNSHRIQSSTDSAHYIQDNTKYFVVEEAWLPAAQKSLNHRNLTRTNNDISTTDMLVQS